MSPWSHLANAKHIDRIIAHARANPTVWEAAWAAAWAAAWDAVKWVAYDAARDAAYEAAFEAAYEAAFEAAYDAFKAPRNTRSGAARYAILALVAWDRAGGLMDSSAEQVKVLALLGDQAAILMYPAIAAMETTQELA